MNLDVLTTRQRVVYDVVQRLDGDLAAAAVELGNSRVSTGDTYQRACDRLARGGLPDHSRPHLVRRLTYREEVEMFGPRLEAIETHLASLLADQAASAALLSTLALEIREWTKRQPLFVEMRPRHQRVADGGPGGVREARGLRKVAGAKA